MPSRWASLQTSRRTLASRGSAALIPRSWRSPWAKVNQAAALIAEHERAGTAPAALAEAFLSGINPGAVAHLNERGQRAL